MQTRQDRRGRCSDLGEILEGRVCVFFLYRDAVGMRVEWDWSLEKKKKRNSNIRKEHP